jgi:hypothetical protein
VFPPKIFPALIELPNIPSPSFLVPNNAGDSFENIFFSGLDLAKSPKSSAGFLTDDRWLLLYSSFALSNFAFSYFSFSYFSFSYLAFYYLSLSYFALYYLSD